VAGAVEAGIDKEHTETGDHGDKGLRADEMRDAFERFRQPPLPDAPEKNHEEDRENNLPGAL
jgi:hypothetical protein